jgi:fructan beta-fructosidase
MQRVLFFCLLVLLFAGCFNSTRPDTENTGINYRPVYHFSPDSNWINDANGLVYNNGRYHLFYQYNPYGSKWGHMSWAHAVSSDLLHWEKMPVALYEDKNPGNNDTSMIFSGSAVIDSNNTSGFGSIENPPMVAIYTAFVHQGKDAKGDYKAVAQNQAIAYSNDKGVSWTKYSGNPVLDINSLEFRDPKVFWYSPQQKWVMAVSKPDEHQAWFYQSKNLKQWEFMSKWGKAGDTSRFWECPDLFELPVTGSGEKKWVLLSSAGHSDKGYVGMQYFIGNFDGTKFTPQHSYPNPVYLDWGKDYYAAVSYNNAPEGKRIIVGWLNNWEYANDIPTGNKWRGAFALPRELRLVKDGTLYKLTQQPVSELSRIEQAAFSLSLQAVDSVYDLSFNGNVYDMELTIEPGTAVAAGLKILKSKGEETILTFDKLTQQLTFDRTKSGNVGFNKRFPSIEKAPAGLKNGKLKLRILVDRYIAEVFINDGETVLTDIVFPLEKDGGIQLFSKGGKAIFSAVKINTIKMQR